MESFESRCNRIVLHDRLAYKNTMISHRLSRLGNDLSTILRDINDQLNAQTRTLAMDFDVLQAQENSEVIINLGGMLLQTVQALAPGKVMEPQLKPAAEIPRLLIVAEVLRSEAIASKKYTTAIAFTYIEPEDKMVLREFVERRLKQNYSEQQAGLPA